MTNRAKEHNFKLGDIVYVASMEDGKLDSKYRDTRYELLKHTSDNSFEMVNAEDGSRIVRNVKHMRHVPIQLEISMPDAAEEQSDQRTQKHCSSQMFQKNHKVLQLQYQTQLTLKKIIH